MVVFVDVFNDSWVGVVVVVLCTTSFCGLFLYVELDLYMSGFDEVNYVKCEDVKLVFDEKLVVRFGTVLIEVMFVIWCVLQFLLDV